MINALDEGMYSVHSALKFYFVDFACFMIS